jgi:hypothetical protein
MSQILAAESRGRPLLPTLARLEAFLLAFAFAVAHTQSPLYYSNQNQYLLHGAALADHGHLAHDWLANTRDPTPLFSALVAAAFSVHPWLLQVAYFLLLMGYFLAARWLVAAMPGFPDSRAARISFAALFTVAHAAIFRYASVQVTGVDYPWYSQAGVAAQYMLGTGLQPSAFGALLLVAVAAFAHGRPVLACAMAGLACGFHSTYLLPAALVVFGILVELIRDSQTRTAIRAAVAALATVAPVVAYTVSQFNPFDPHSDNALHILADIRIPHHCVIRRWFDVVAGLQLIWIALGLVVLRKTPVGRVLLVAGVCGVALTLLQYATDSDRLALAFPWRISVLLVPVATAALIAKLLAWKLPGKWAERGAFAILAALAAGGIAVTACGLGYRTVDEHGLYDHIRATATPDDVYLLPVQLPNVGTGRGAVSNTFAPPPRAKEGTNQIPVDLQRFRLETGACIYVDFKSVPYEALEVEEWHRRMQFATDFNAKSVRDYAAYRDALKREGITHVVVPASRPFVAEWVEEVYSDDAYIVYRVK